MSMSNGSTQGLPSIQLPTTIEAAQQLTLNAKLGLQDVVGLIIIAPGRSLSLLMLPDDVIKWGETLMRAGGAAKSGLITP